MKLWLAGDIIAKLDAELDVQDDNWISSSEKYSAINEAIDVCERIVHTIHLDYFKKKAFIPVVQGTSVYSVASVLPDMYANYIRRLYWVGAGAYNPSVSSENYEIPKIKLDEILTVEASENYRYDLENTSTATGHQLVIYPPPRETAATKVLAFYIRNANTVVGPADVVDIPEAHTYVFLYVKMKYLEKDKGNPLYPTILEALKQEEGALRNALAAMAPEAASGEIEADYSFYEELY